MAGIGFVLRKLMRQNDLSSILTAFYHSMMASTGPWLITILALGSFFLLGQSLSDHSVYILFRLIIMFNFSISLVLAAPIANCATRYLADILYLKEVDKGAGLMMGMLILLFIVGLPLACIYYIFFTTMPGVVKFHAIFNFMLIASIWLLCVFIAALKYYKAITFSFIAGMIISILCAIKLAATYSMLGMLTGFNLGLAFIVASLLALIFAEYPPVIQEIFRVLSYFKKYWEVALGFGVYAAGLWVDKWIMWFAPESVVASTGMRMYPDYDTAMFISYLTVIPAMALFLLSQETAFYESYFRYYQGIQNHDNFDKIKANHKKIIQIIEYLGRNLILFQSFICIAVILLAPYLFQLLGLNLIQIGMFRAGVLGASLQVLSLFIMVLLSYFDYRKGVMLLQFLFFITNALFTWLTLRLGFPFYGYGFFASSLLTFLASAVMLEQHLRRLPYHTFVTQNIKRHLRKQEEQPPP
jgi:uncharacterized membrane protein